MLLSDEIINVYCAKQNLFHKSWVLGGKVISIDYFGVLSDTECIVWDSIENYLFIIRNINWISEQVDISSLERKFIINKLVFDKYFKH